MATPTVPLPRDASQVARLLGTPEIRALIVRLEDTRWTGRPGYPIRSMLGMALVKSLYTLPTWTRVVALVTDHAALRKALGLRTDKVPSQWACYRFANKLREHGDPLTECIDAVLAGLRNESPSMGTVVAIDGSDLPAYANGQRFVEGRPGAQAVYADPDASLGPPLGDVHPCTGRRVLRLQGPRRRLHHNGPAGRMASRDREGRRSPGGAVPARHGGSARVHDDLRRAGQGLRRSPRLRWVRGPRHSPDRPAAQTRSVVGGDHKPPTCEHGEWTFAGSDAKRGASKWRCPTGECQPASVWIKADRLHTLVPRSTDRWGALYRQRGAVEREFGVLKHQWAMLPLRVRRLPRVRLHVDLTILARLATALDNARGAHASSSVAA